MTEKQHEFCRDFKALMESTGEFTAEIIGNIYDNPELDKGGNKNAR